MKMEKSKAFLVSSEAARDRCQALSPTGNSQRRLWAHTQQPGQASKALPVHTHSGKGEVPLMGGKGDISHLTGR